MEQNKKIFKKDKLYSRKKKYAEIWAAKIIAATMLPDISILQNGLSIMQTTTKVHYDETTNTWSWSFPYEID